MATIKITDESFEKDVLKNGKICVVDFWAEWCGPCRQLTPILEEISAEMSDVIFAKHNIDEQPNIPVKYGVRGIPTMLIFKNGELKGTKVGATTKSNIVSWIKENLYFKLKIFPIKYNDPKDAIIFGLLLDSCLIADLMLGATSQLIPDRFAIFFKL